MPRLIATLLGVWIFACRAAAQEPLDYGQWAGDEVRAMMGEPVKPARFVAPPPVVPPPAPAVALPPPEAQPIRAGVALFGGAQFTAGQLGIFRVAAAPRTEAFFPASEPGTSSNKLTIPEAAIDAPSLGLAVAPQVGFCLTDQQANELEVSYRGIVPDSTNNREFHDARMQSRCVWLYPNGEVFLGTDARIIYTAAVSGTFEQTATRTFQNIDGEGRPQDVPINRAIDRTLFAGGGGASAGWRRRWDDLGLTVTGAASYTACVGVLTVTDQVATALYGRFTDNSNDATVLLGDLELRLTATYRPSAFPSSLLSVGYRLDYFHPLTADTPGGSFVLHGLELGLGWTY